MHANRNNDQIEPKDVLHVIVKCVRFVSFVRFMVLLSIEHALERGVEQENASAQYLEKEAQNFEDEPLFLLGDTFRRAYLPIESVIMTHVPICVHGYEEVQ